MPRLGSSKRPAIVKVQTPERLDEIASLCERHGWKYIAGLEPDEDEDISDVERLLHPPEQARARSTVGRNDPCSCGSGRKYKKCCGASVAGATSERANVDPGSMRVRQALLEAALTQVRENDPPEAAAAHARLIGVGYSPEDATILIARVLACEIHEIDRDRREADHDRYARALNALPDLIYEADPDGTETPELGS